MSLFVHSYYTARCAIVVNTLYKSPLLLLLINRILSLLLERVHRGCKLVWDFLYSKCSVWKISVQSNMTLHTLRNLGVGMEGGEGLLLSVAVWWSAFTFTYLWHHRWLHNQFPPLFSVLNCPLGLGEFQACPFPDVVFPLLTMKINIMFPTWQHKFFCFKVILNTDPTLTHNAGDRYHWGDVCDLWECWKVCQVPGDHKSADSTEHWWQVSLRWCLWPLRVLESVSGTWWSQICRQHRTIVTGITEVMFVGLENAGKCVRYLVITNLQTARNTGDRYQ